MKKLGVVHNLSYRGDLIVKAPYVPSVGQEVLDKRGLPLGKVRRVFGPVKAPYVSVEPFREPGLALVRSQVFVEVQR